MATLFDTGIFSAVGLDSELLSGATIGWYVGGTTTPIDSFTTSALSVANLNPVPAGADGRFPAIWLAAGTYKYILKTSAGVTLATRDGFIAAAAAPSFSTDLTDFLAGDDPLPLANGGTNATSAVDALATLGALPKAGGALTGGITQTGNGAYMFEATSSALAGAVFVTANNAADPRTGNNQWWATYEP